MSRYKYPRTPHLPWSPGASDDDLFTDVSDPLRSGEVVVTEKMDGENTTIYADHVHARSMDSVHHPSRAWVKALAARVGPDLPDGWRLCGENLYARHSIAYEELPSWFVLFSVWDDTNRCLSWEETVAWADLLDLALPTVLYAGPWDERLLRGLHETLDLQRQEGFVVRTAAGFAYEDFGEHVAKWVRKGHVTTSEHWMSQPVVPNGVRS